MAVAPRNMIIRAASAADDDAIMAIWNHEVRSGDATFTTAERSGEQQVAWRSGRGERHPVLVGVVADVVVAYGTLSPYRATPPYRETAEDAVYVDRQHRGAGYGGAMLDRLIELAQAHGFHALMARITGGNDGSVRLHERRGFALVGVEREIGFKFGRWMDVVLMQRILSDRQPPEGT